MISDPLDACVAISRRLGRDPDLVLHGGGNSSVKASVSDVTGGAIDALWIKGSGADMAEVQRAGFTALRLDRLRELLALDALVDTAMMRELAAAKLDPGAPAPSVETLLHVVLPQRFVLHSHADAIVTLTNLDPPDGRIGEVLGDRTLLVPYVMPGFALAKAVSACWPEATDRTIGLTLLNHGLVTFGDTADEALDRHLELVSLATTWLDDHAPRRSPSAADALVGPAPTVTELADLRRAISTTAGRPMVVQRATDPDVARFAGRPDLTAVASRGPLTPDHVIRTKRVPMVGSDVEGYAAAYRAYVEANAGRGPDPVTPLDPAPRVVLDPRLGMLTAGPSARDATIAADVYRHTMAVIERSEDHLGGYRALPAGDIFDVEYWDLEQAKLRRAGAPPPFGGMVALVTGAASGIGRASAAALLDAGAAVVGLDIEPRVVDAFAGPAWLGIRTDVTDHDAQGAAIDAAVERFGGVDVVVVCAGVFGPSQPIAALEAADWSRSFAVMVDAVADLFRLVHPLLARSPVGGRVAVTASKNVHAPGPGAAAYSASKAALTQLARIAALEWAADDIRVNIVHPDAVFDTGLWSGGLVEDRAARYGLTVEAYKRRNLLGREITAASVARVIVELCSDSFAMTTGAQVTVDGGNERTI